MALCYPDGTESDNLKGQKFEWAIRSPRTKDNPPEWVLGGLDDLATVILQLPNELGDPDTLAERLSNTLETAVSRLSNDTKEAFAEVWICRRRQESKYGDNEGIACGGDRDYVSCPIGRTS